MKTYYAVQYRSGANTTTGEPNSRGRMSIACSPESFSSKSERDEWVSNGEYTSAMRGNCREAVTVKKLGQLRPSYFSQTQSNW